MSDFAFFRFMSSNMLTKEEEEHKDEIIELTEEILHAKGLQCDASIAKISEEQLEEILGKVRELRKKRKKAYGTNIVVVEYDEKDEQKEEIPVVQ
jgi:tetrahydromethanopterin S-methyltransferase subunit A